MNKELSEKELMLLDEVAELSLGGNEVFDRMREIYNGNRGLKVPATFMSYSPVSKPKEITLIC